MSDVTDPESDSPLTPSSSTSDSSDESGSSSRAFSQPLWFSAKKTKQLACLGLASAVGLIVGAPVGSAVTYIAMGGSLASLSALFTTNITAPAAFTTSAPVSTLSPLEEAREKQKFVTCQIAYGQLPSELIFDDVVYLPRQTTPDCDERVDRDMLVPHPGTNRLRDTSDMWGQRTLAFFKAEITRNPSLGRLFREKNFVGNMHWVLCAFSFEEKEEIKKHFPLMTRAIEQGFSCPDRGCISQR